MLRFDGNQAALATVPGEAAHVRNDLKNANGDYGKWLDGVLSRLGNCGHGSMKIFALDNFRRRNPKGYFADFPLDARHRAYQWLHRFVTRWGNDMPNWRFAILVGQAKRLALNPPTSSGGRSMLAKRGGLAVQQKYRSEDKHPTRRATRARLAKQQKTESSYSIRTL